MKWLRRGLILISVFGVVASAAGFAVVTLGGGRVEAASNEFVISGIEKRIRKLVTVEPTEADGRLADFRNKMAENSERLADRILGGDLAVRVRDRVQEACICELTVAERAAVVSGYAEARTAVAKMIEAIRNGKLSEVRMEKGTVGKLLAGYHLSTVDGLKRELRIFLGSNLVLSALIGIAAWFSAATNELLFPAGILLLGTLTAGGFYIFVQDWLATILLHDWTGYAYLVWVVAISLFLADILLNRARVTGHILSSISPTNVSPC